MENKIKVVLALFIPYAFFCAGLYQMAFWSTFDINIFSFLDLGDIIKSFIYPFFYSASGALILSVFQFDQAFDRFPYGGGNKGAQSKRKEITGMIIKIVYVLLLTYCIFFLNSKYKWGFVPFLFLPGLYFYISESLLKSNVISHNKYRFFLIYILILLPVLAISSGKNNALAIFDNTKMNYTYDVLPQKLLKFLGKASNYYIFTTYTNKDKYFFDISEIKGLHLLDFNKTDTDTIPVKKAETDIIP